MHSLDEREREREEGVEEEEESVVVVELSHDVSHGVFSHGWK